MDGGRGFYGYQPQPTGEGQIIGDIGKIFSNIFTQMPTLIQQNEKYQIWKREHQDKEDQKEILYKQFLDSADDLGLDRGIINRPITNQDTDEYLTQGLSTLFAAAKGKGVGDQEILNTALKLSGAGSVEGVQQLQKGVESTGAYQELYGPQQTEMGGMPGMGMGGGGEPTLEGSALAQPTGLPPGTPTPTGQELGVAEGLGMDPFQQSAQPQVPQRQPAQTIYPEMSMGTEAGGELGTLATTGIGEGQVRNAPAEAELGTYRQEAEKAGITGDRLENMLYKLAQDPDYTSADFDKEITDSIKRRREKKEQLSEQSREDLIKARTTLYNALGSYDIYDSETGQMVDKIDPKKSPYDYLIGTKKRVIPTEHVTRRVGAGAGKAPEELISKYRKNKIDIDKIIQGYEKTTGYSRYSLIASDKVEDSIKRKVKQLIADSARMDELIEAEEKKADYPPRLEEGEKGKGKLY